MSRLHIILGVLNLDAVNEIRAEAAFDNGRVVEVKRDSDGTFTVIVEFPQAAAGPGATAIAAAVGLSAALRSDAGAAGRTPFAPVSDPTPWLTIARAEMGVAEAVGGLDNPRIEQYQATTDGEVNHDSVPWCSSFVNWCVTRAGLRGTDSKLARSWLEWGVAETVEPPPVGSIVVFRRGHPPHGHVGFVVGSDGGQLTVLAGNQLDRVSVASFDARDVLGVRRPAPAALSAAGLGDATSAPAQRRRRIDTLARTLWGEARGEPERGLEAIAAVVVNRMRRGPAERFGEGIDGVCRQPRQFSCWNDDDPNRAKLLAVTAADAAFERCLRVAERAVDGTLIDPTSGSDHYHTAGVAPDWSVGHMPVVTIGSHRFFNDIA